MRVLVANKFFFRNGGSEVVMFQERDFLLRSGHEVVDFSMQDERNADSPYSSNFVQARDYRGDSKFAQIGAAVALVRSREAVARIGRLIDETNPDLMHCHNIYHQLTPAIIGAAKLRGVPVVMTLHDYKPVCPVYNRLRHGQPCSACLDGDFSHVLIDRCADGSLGRSALLYAEAVIQRWLGNYEKVDRFLAPSRFLQDSVLHRFRPQQVVVLPNGVDVGAISPTWRDDGYVLYLGRLSEEKGVETLLRSHAAARGAWPLLVAGTGPLAESFKQQYRNANFAGHLVGVALRDAISNAAVVVVPSECYENCPMSILEGMAYGKPVVGSRIGGIPELVVDSETGYLFDAGNTNELTCILDKLMSSPGMRNQMGMAARQRVEAYYSLDLHNAELMNIYKTVLGS